MFPTRPFEPFPPITGNKKSAQDPSASPVEMRSLRLAFWLSLEFVVSGPYTCDYSTAITLILDGLPSLVRAILATTGYKRDLSPYFRFAILIRITKAGNIFMLPD